MNGTSDKLKPEEFEASGLSLSACSTLNSLKCHFVRRCCCSGKLAAHGPCSRILRPPIGQFRPQFEIELQRHCFLRSLSNPENKITFEESRSQNAPAPSHRRSPKEYVLHPHNRNSPSSPYLRTSATNNVLGCAEVVAALDECHARGFLWKVTGNCTDAKYKVNMCLRGLRLEKTRQNREAAKEKREHIKKVWAELDANK